jgi:hypothetical protein
VTKSRFGAPLFGIACIVMVLAPACGASSRSTPAVASQPSMRVPSMSLVLPDATPAVFAAVRETPADDKPPTHSVSSACSAPSVLRPGAADDAGDPDAPADCSAGDAWRPADAEQAAAAHCDMAGRHIDLARLLEGALPLDADTTEHVRHLFRDGQAHGRRGDEFGLVGDSMTVAWNFLAPFAQGAGDAVVPSDVESALALASPVQGARDVLALFRGARRHGESKIAGLDPFVAPRAAKVGVRANWPLAPRGPQQPSPLEEMVGTVSPAYAVVLYGANDAVWLTDPIDSLASNFSTALSAIVDALEARGVVPVLTTVPKHMHARGWPDCARATGAASNERFATQATALSAAVADVACRRHLPLIDLRWSLEPLINHGVGPDGVHLSAHRQGGGVLDGSGLQCGYNVRNLVTLRELALVVDAVSTEVGGAATLRPGPAP